MGWSPNLGEVVRRVSESGLIIGFNLKYDLQWARRCNLPVAGKRYWDCQVAEFLLGRQEHPYPSLDETGRKYGLGGKDDTVDREFWSKGVNTPDIPRETLGKYALRDGELTYNVYRKQQELIPPHQRVLFSLYMQDLAVLADIEWNGLHYDTQLIKQKEEECAKRIKDLQAKIGVYADIPGFNWNSNDHLSALLFGGEIRGVVKRPDGFFKSGQKVGQPKFRNEEVVYKLPRKYKPVRGSEREKEGYWSVDEDSLRKLPKSELIDGILEIKGLEKLNNTYYRKLQEHHDNMHFKPEIIHGQYNQVVARTGRLSSSNPNMQNIASDVKEIFTTRYD